VDYPLHGIPSLIMSLDDIPERNDSGSRQATDSIPPTTLEALRSPVSTTLTSLQNRESVSEAEFNDVALDDETVLSPVTLASRRTSTDSLLPRPEDDKNIRTDNSFDESPISVSMKHKKTVSTTTIRSSHDRPFFELQDTTAKSNRGSVDGQQKLQEDFARMHKEAVGTTDTSADNAIDWAFWGTVISDYQGYTAERPEELAHAIAKGIPATLRGMMWQHMAASKDPDIEETYLKLLKGSSVHEKAITRDLGRTFPHHEFFTNGSGIGQENLFNVLKAYSL